MNGKNRGLRVLSLAFLAVAGLMAFMATGAQALWLENGTAIGANKLVEVSTHKEGVLDVKEENELELKCATVAGDDVLILTGTTTATGKLLFSNCKVFQKGVEKPECNKKVDEGGTVLGLLEPITASGKGKLLLHNSKNYVLFEPEVVGGNFAQIRFDPPCALPEVNNVKGTLVAECLTSALAAADCAASEKIHLLQQAPAELFDGLPEGSGEPKDVLLYGTKVARLLGVAKTALASGNAWAGHV